MVTSSLIDRYTPVGDIITFFTCIVLLLIICNALYYANDKCFTYLKRAIHFVLFGAFSNFMFMVTCSLWPDKTVLIFVFRDIYHVLLLISLETFIVYTRRLLNISGKMVKTVGLFTHLIFGVGIILDVLSPFTHFGFYYADGIWHDSVFIKPFTFVYIYALVLFAVIFLLYSKRMIKPVRRSLLATEIIIVGILFHQNMRSTNSMTAFTFLLPIITVLILLHSRPYEPNTGALSADSFDYYLTHSKKKGYSMDYMLLKLDTRVSRKIPSELGKTMNSFWHDYFKDASLFIIDSGVYVLAITRSKKNGDTDAKINELIFDKFPVYYDMYNIHYHIMGLSDIDFLNNVEELKDIMNYFIDNEHDNSSLIIKGKDVEKARELTRTKACLRDIEKQQNLNDERVIALCQPVKNTKTGKYDTAEALMRLTVDGKTVFPDMFIPMAENAGYIHTLTKIILNKVCVQINEMLKEGYEFSRISVNIALLELCEPDFVEEIVNIINSNNIPLEKIALEITESENESDYKVVVQKIQKLKEFGLKVYLDDYGTGYSNFDRIMGLGVDIIKFDRSILLIAEKSPEISHSIGHFSKAFKELKYNILFEGVETDEHEKMCVDYGADYLQGYKFSRPIPIEDLTQFFSKNPMA